MTSLSRLTPTLGICVAGAAVSAALLALPADEPTVAPAAAAVAPDDAGGYTGEGAVPTNRQRGYLDPDDTDDVADSGRGGSPSAAPAPGAITIEDFAFGAPITVAPGTVVNVTNVDGAPHTVTATDGGFDTGNLAGGAAGSFTAPAEPGTYEFFCAIHPSMTGQLTVQA